MLSLSKRLEGAIPTNELYRAGDSYISDRVAVHNEILDKLFTPKAVSAAIPAAGEQPVFVVLGGRGGAGKSWFTKDPGSPFDASKFMYINSDDFKEALPEYAGWNTALLHEESSDLAARAHAIARKMGLNVIFDATLRSTSTSHVVQTYKAAGYKVKGYFMHTAPHVSAVRAAKRFVHTGRFVPPEYILTSTTNEASFDAMTHLLDDWGVYDNNSGTGPKRVAHKGAR